MRKSLLALIVMVALLTLALVGCGASADAPNGDSATPPAESVEVGEATDENPFVGRWTWDGGYVEYRADGTWVDSVEDDEGAVVTSSGTYEVVAADGHYELRELWDETEDLAPMVVFVVFDDGKAGFFETLTALNQNEIATVYTETAPGQWER